MNHNDLLNKLQFSKDADEIEGAFQGLKGTLSSKVNQGDYSAEPGSNPIDLLDDIRDARLAELKGGSPKVPVAQMAGILRSLFDE